MDESALRHLLEEVRTRSVSADDAVRALQRLPFAELGYAKVDHHRMLRQGLPEAVYGPGKTPAQCAAIVAELLTGGSGGPVLRTRAGEAQVAAAVETSPGGVRTPSVDTAGRLTTVAW